MTKSEVKSIVSVINALRGWSWECQSDHFIPADNLGKRLQKLLPKKIKEQLKKKYE